MTKPESNISQLELVKSCDVCVLGPDTMILFDILMKLKKTKISFSLK